MITGALIGLLIQSTILVHLVYNISESIKNKNKHE